VYWFRRPPIGRFALAALLIALGIYAEFAPVKTVAHPFTETSVVAGQSINSVVWREVAVGLFAPIEDQTELVAKVDLPPNTPLIPAVLGTIKSPPGWWSLVIDLPTYLDPGTRLAILPDPEGEPVEGLVLASTPVDQLAYGVPTGLVAVEAEGAPAIAKGAAVGSLIVLLLPG